MRDFRLNSWGSRLLEAGDSCYGSAVPDLDFTVEISELLIKPFTVTSVRKVEAVGTVPLWALVWLITEMLTKPMAVVSPRSTPTRIKTMMGYVPYTTPQSQTQIVLR